MPRPRLYTDQAAKQAAYRERLRAAPRAGKQPNHSMWRKSLRDAHALLSETSQSIQTWTQERSQDWKDSDQATAIDEDLAALGDILESIESLNIWEPRR